MMMFLGAAEHARCLGVTTTTACFYHLSHSTTTPTLYYLMILRPINNNNLWHHPTAPPPIHCACSTNVSLLVSCSWAFSGGWDFYFCSPIFFSRSSQFSDSLQFFAVTELISTLSPQDSISEHFLLIFLRDR